MNGDTMAAVESEDGRLTALMAAAQEGERAAYETLLRESVPIIRRVARRQGANGDRIDDVVQDALVTLHRVRQTFDPKRSYIAWLTAITQRRAIDILRRHGRVGAREVHAPLAYEAHADEDDPSRTVDARDDADRLRRAVAELPAGQREAVEKLAFQEYSLEEAARETGRTKTALKVNLHRAIKALRARMASER